MSDNVRAEILRIFNEVIDEAGGETMDEIADDAVLLESGLDSLGFAILVARLDEELCLDPFSESEVAYYPQTFGEFVGIYQEARAP